MLNTGGRVDDAKCYPETREEVIGFIEQWMETGDDTKRFLWLSGPAGGGKTAIMKTIAERSKDRPVQTVNFFFFRGDPTRNNAQSLVATLLYQIFQLCPTAHDAVATVLSAKPLLLDASIQEQFDQLICPLSDIILESSPERTPIVLLIDGLDECDVDAKLSQEQVLRALDGLVTQSNSPFLVLVASRPSSHIQMVFNQLASKAQSIFLDDRYFPEKDIRHFVIAEFDRIKASHPSVHLLPDNWPSESAIDTIVTKSSGQFIYAATVMRFLAYPSRVPSRSLDMVQGAVPVGRDSPFVQLDAIYTYILSQVDDREVTLDVLSSILLEDLTRSFSCMARTLRGCPHWPPFGRVVSPIHEVLSVYNSTYTYAMVESSLFNLAAIVQHQGNQLVFYHASLADFLQDPFRSKIFQVHVKTFTFGVFMAVQNFLGPTLKWPCSRIDHCWPEYMNAPFPWGPRCKRPQSIFDCLREGVDLFDCMEAL
ncbi:hypothetical protein D9619_010827 [Psilocybe cf. subviscida]|uniref:NACHT domain-containing protein n=1 Tax=Psilocybe cf. subviscida TaxID=2480587 RepID=A0A8H5B9A1_9AGAR|nr:hypothetical protein D9619_010827 [Psilocybe cf. subviscida]